ncbi:hypothetical protein ACF08M_36130 [Streptomyces sp. NPDC015032]|uniref:hypothetical protein n=1 Tax=Streptomyces sp. NPDC015032 TaxID=3364937 RepID=UPI0036FB880C
MSRSESIATSNSKSPRWLRAAQVIAGALTGVAGALSFWALLVGLDAPVEAWVSLFAASGTLWVGLLSFGRPERRAGSGESQTPR